MSSIVAACAAVLLISFELPGCTPVYWVPGLSLPPGSAVTMKSETTSMQGLPAIPMLGSVDKVLTVQFTNPAGWSVVSAHIDGCMRAQGYTDTMGGLAGMMGGAMPAGTSNMMSSMRDYTKAGSKFTVMLEDMGGLMSAYGAAQSAAQRAAIPGMGGFDLSIMRMK